MTDALKGKARMAQLPVANQIEVRVFANKVDNTVVFTHDWRANGAQYTDPPIILPKNDPMWQLTYTLYDFSQKNLTFLQNNQGTAEEAMWVRKGNSCPMGKGNGDNQIQFGPCGPTTLTVLDFNDGEECTLRYMLSFQDDNKRPQIYRYDPEIKNGGTN